MNRARSSLLFWGLLFPPVLTCLCGGFVNGADTGPKAFQLQHDGLLRFTKSSASMRGIGDTVILHEDFELAVEGQFQMIGSSRLVREAGIGRAKRFRTEPVCISIVAIGKVRLKFPETSEAFSARTAVYRVSDHSWILDGVPLKHGGVK